jgi:hypothetical protein
MDKIDKIDEKLLDGPPKKIGLQGKKPVYQFRTKGGLYIVGTPKKNNSGGIEFLGSGPHRQVARIIAERNVAQKNEEDIVWTELSKSDHVDPDHFALILPEYEELTQKLRLANGD